MLKKLNQYCITKYDPIYRVNGVYSRNEWTSIYDIGKKYGTKVFTIDEYLKVEKAYINVIQLVLDELNITSLRIIDMDPHFRQTYRYPNDSTLNSIEDILSVARDCLREDCWCKLVCDNFYIHFGYDYYMYIGCQIKEQRMNQIVSLNALFVESIEESPYSIRDNDD